jgi:uncharacterized protein (DUF305 family)
VVPAALAVLAVVLLAGSGSDPGDARPDRAAAPNVVQAGAPGEDSRTLSEEELAEIEPPKQTAEDVEFVQEMIHHHAQALEMTAFVPERSAGRNLPLLAERMEVSQQSEIELMEKWLRNRGEQPPAASAHMHEHGGELMPGMLTAAELARLQAAEGGRFNRLFVRYMNRHHQGAFTMIAELHDANGGQEPELDNLVRHIEADQGIEIDRMRQLRP